MKKISVVKAFDSIAGEWNEKHPAPRAWVPLFKTFLKKKGVLLDAGCGNGVNSIAFAPLVEKIYAIDASRRMVEFARVNVSSNGLNDKIIVKKASILSLPFNDSFFDAVAYFAVIHHFAKPREWRKIFSEMRRVLKRGGLAFVTAWNKLKAEQMEAHAQKTMFVHFTKKTGERVPRLHYFFGELELARLAEENGFRVKSVFYERGGKKSDRAKGKNLCLVLRKP